jgi:hypothetical protein
METLGEYALRQSGEPQSEAELGSSSGVCISVGDLLIELIDAGGLNVDFAMRWLFSCMTLRSKPHPDFRRFIRTSPN